MARSNQPVLELTVAAVYTTAGTQHIQDCLAGLHRYPNTGHIPISLCSVAAMPTRARCRSGSLEGSIATKGAAATAAAAEAGSSTAAVAAHVHSTTCCAAAAAMTMVPVVTPTCCAQRLQMTRGIIRCTLLCISKHAVCSCHQFEGRPRCSLLGFPPGFVWVEPKRHLPARGKPPVSAPQQGTGVMVCVKKRGVWLHVVPMTAAAASHATPKTDCICSAPWFGFGAITVRQSPHNMTLAMNRRAHLCACQYACSTAGDRQLLHWNAANAQPASPVGSLHVCCARPAAQGQHLVVVPCLRAPQRQRLPRLPQLGWDT